MTLSSDFSVIALRIGTIVNVLPFPKARKPAYQMILDYGSIQLRSSAQLPPNYSDPETLIGRQVMTVANFPEKRIAGFVSQVLVLGFPDKNNSPIAMGVRQKVLGGCYVGSETAKAETLSRVEGANGCNLTWENFDSVPIRCGRILEIDDVKSALLIDLGSSQINVNLRSFELFKSLVGQAIPIYVSSSPAESFPLFAHSGDGNVCPIVIDDLNDLILGSKIF